MESDKLKDMFDKQKELQIKLGNTDILYNVQYLKDMILASVDELMEVLREIPWKNWKKQQEFHKEELKEEIVDVYHFLINISLASGMDYEELHERYMNKNKINHQRQKDGY